MRWIPTLKARGGATFISAVGTDIHCPETVSGAEASGLCPAVRITGTVDDTDAGAGQPVVMGILSRGHLPWFPASVLLPCTVHTLGAETVFPPLSPEYWGSPPSV